MDANARRTEDGAGSWKVGELAERTGLSVRALHYYEEIGLLSPSRRTGSGYRLGSAERASAEDFVQTAMEVMEMSERIERYYTPEQLEQLEARRREFGEE